MYKVIAGYTVLFIFILYIFSSCHPGKKGIFGTKKSAHSKYAENLKKAGLQHTTMVTQWQLSAEKSVAEPLPVTLPYKEAGYFAAEEPRAAGYRLRLQQGVNLEVSLLVVSSSPKTVFLELWKTDTANVERDLLAEADSTFHLLYEIEDDGIYIIRFQPELLAAMEYTLTITTHASLAFPVSETGKPAMISFWNDKRDAGRNHEGVDIRASFRTPAVAAANGYVRNVTENRLGGKVIFLRPEGKNYSLYYAHLDTQLVSEGQIVMKGQPVGLVGNTGNALNTTPHLHFGIYTRGGAVDPLPFIDNRTVQPKNITASQIKLNKWVRATKNSKIFEEPSVPADTASIVQRGTVMKVLSATADRYGVQFANGRMGFIKSELVTDQPLMQITTDTLIRMLDEPIINAAAMTVIPSRTKLQVMGESGQYYRVHYEKRHGWIKKKEINQ